MKKIFLYLIVIIALGAGVVFFEAFRFLNSSPSQQNEVVTFDISPGQSFRSVAQRLKDQAFVTDLFLFRVYAKVTRGDQRMRVGEYALSRNMKPGQILRILTSGKSIERAFTVREGDNMYDIANEFQKNGFGQASEFLKWAKDFAFVSQLLGEPQESLEGYLFPETYNLTKFIGAKNLIEIMVKKFLEEYKKVASSDTRGLTRHQIVTLASVIEKETGAPEERPLISSVFHNRLVKKMRIQSDPTIIYGILRKTGVEPKNIRKADILAPTPWNTYTVSALPFGPIGNPGREALAAVFRPAVSEYLFFVSKNDGTHVFTTNVKDHNNAVNEWQRNRANRVGKSWRDLKKKTGSK